jgi:hypothetical protein
VADSTWRACKHGPRRGPSYLNYMYMCMNMYMSCACTWSRRKLGPSASIIIIYYTWPPQLERADSNGRPPCELRAAERAAERAAPTSHAPATCSCVVADTVPTSHQYTPHRNLVAIRRDECAYSLLVRPSYVRCTTRDSAVHGCTRGGACRSHVTEHVACVFFEPRKLWACTKAAVVGLGDFHFG